MRPAARGHSAGRTPYVTTSHPNDRVGPGGGGSPGACSQPADISVAPAREGEGNVSRKDDSMNDFTSGRRQSDRACVIAAFPELNSSANKRPPVLRTPRAATKGR